MKQPTLVILAAGMASRYGSMKQTQSFGPSGETIMEYSIYDAIRAGFKKVIFIIREEFADTFKGIVEPKLKGKIEIDYVYQELHKYLGGRSIPADRTKPWGTGHAVLCCQGVVNEPFAVINADDFYGADAFNKAYNFLTTACSEQVYASIAYKMVNTLSENGSVSRGVIEVSDNNEFLSITERLKIFRKEDGQIVFEENDTLTPLADDALVSMNFFCFAPGFIDLCGRKFDAFLDARMTEQKSEFLMPTMVDQFIKDGLGTVKAISTDAKWFGVTYKEDAPVVQASVNALVEKGEYPANLWK